MDEEQTAVHSRIPRSSLTWAISQHIVPARAPTPPGSPTRRLSHQSLSAHRLPDHRLEPFRRGPARFTQVDLVVLLPCLISLLGDELMELFNGRRFFRVGTHVHDLSRQSLVTALKSDLGQRRRVFLLLNLCQRLCHQLLGDILGLHHHHRPLPGALVPLGKEPREWRLNVGLPATSPVAQFNEEALDQVHKIMDITGFNKLIEKKEEQKENSAEAKKEA